jgi:hypothetical protein
MTDNQANQNSTCVPRHHYNRGGGGGVVYGLGFIGAAIFFVGQATSFWPGVLGVLKALVWPAYLVYEALKFLIK